MASICPISRDWEPVVIRKKAPNAAAKKDEKAVNAAHRSGANIKTVKKSNAGTNKVASSSMTLNTRKLNDETENLSHDRVSNELKKNIMQGRIAKKFTQAQLAQVINEKPQVIQEYESGKAIPNQQTITKLERVLGVKLRRKKNTKTLIREKVRVKDREVHLKEKSVAIGKKSKEKEVDSAEQEYGQRMVTSRRREIVDSGSERSKENNYAGNEAEEADQAEQRSPDE